MAQSGEDGPSTEQHQADSLTFFPSYENDMSPTSTIRYSPEGQRRLTQRPNITPLLFTPRTASFRTPLFEGYDPLANELHDALQDHSSLAPTPPMDDIEGEFAGLERSTSAPPQDVYTSPTREDIPDKKAGRRKHGNSVSSIPAFFRPRAATIEQSSSQSPTISRPASVASKRQLAPVEMNYWLPQEALPPALNKQDITSNTLIDEFGFLHEEKRKRRQHDGAQRRQSLAQASARPASPSSSTYGHSRPSSISLSLNASISPKDGDENDEKSSANIRWQDYLTLDAASATQFLSDMPFSSTFRIMDRVRAAVGSGAATLPVNKADPVTALSPQTVSSPLSAASTAEVFLDRTRSESSSATDVSIHTQDTSSISQSHGVPAQSAETLLKQVNDDHERSQQKKRKEFEDFMNRALALRLRNEMETTSTTRPVDPGNSKLHLSPEAHLVEGSVIGFASIGLSGRGAKAKRKELHRLILQGIPVELRSKVWGECMRSQVQGDPEYYHALLSNPEYATLEGATVRDAIDADVQRTLKDNVYFRDPDGPGTQKLTDVLVALARRNPAVGYCQGMNLIAGSLLLVLPTAEEAFWVMVFLTEKILPEAYMGDALITSRADAKVLRRYVGEQMPTLATCFDRHDVWLEFEVVAISWFVSAFTAVFCGEALYRVWDVVFCWNDGGVFLLCVALALLKLNEKALLACAGRSEISGYLNAQMTDHAVSVDGVIRAANALRKVMVKEDVELRRKQEVADLQG